MKVHVFVDDSGRVVGSTPVPEERNEGSNAFVKSMPAKASARHRTYEIELTDSMAPNTRSETTDDFHKLLEQHIKSRADLKPLPES